MTPTETYKKLIREKCPPKNENEKVYASIILAISENLDALRLQVNESTKAIKFIAKVVSEMRGDTASEAGGETASASTEDAAAIPTPDVSSGPAVNPQPIPPPFPASPTPQAASTAPPIPQNKNGSKGVNA